MVVGRDDVVLRLPQLPFDVSVQQQRHLDVDQRQRGQHADQHQKAGQRGQAQPGGTPDVVAG
ncbi:hypothetical protein SDC9_179823 [bioreactor metagenome]|uniref:Uncharacterized protein n=1 Tax=bioreactor metagenome TaxID=1076179 RepID=A0A645GZW3_9ZZZZ